MARRFVSFAIFALVMTSAGASAQVAREPLSLGALDNGVYRNSLTGVEFNLPADWVIVNEGRSSSGAGSQYVTLRDTTTNEIGTVWLKARAVNAADLPALLSRRLDSKAAQRNNFEGYKYRDGSEHQFEVSGKPALSAIADYVRNGRQMSEYITWVDGEKSRVVFGARMETAALAGFQSRFDQIIQSAVVP